MAKANGDSLSLSMQADVQPGTEAIRRRKMLAAVLIVGAVSELTALGIFAVLHIMVYLPAAAGIILGLHLLPLAGVNRQPVFRIIGWAMAAWSAGCLLLTSRSVLMSSAGTLLLAATLAATLLMRSQRAMPS